MRLRPLLPCLALALLTGCQWLPERLQGPTGAPPQVLEASDPGACYAEVPGFDDAACLLHDWVGFGLAAQRGNRAWRDTTLERLAGDATERRLARAVALAWGSAAQWDRASELFKADLHAAPARLQPLLRYWLNEVERRRGLHQRLVESDRAREALTEENAALAEKLDALTDIERNINMRQQTE